MRTFVLYARKAVTDQNFNINDMPSSGGRMDLVARCISASLFISGAMRRDTNIFVVLNGPPRAPVTIEFNGEALKRLSPDERSAGSWIQKVLAGRIDKEWSNPFEDIRVSAKSFQDIIRELADAGRPIYMLHENGTPLSEMKIDKDPVLVLGDHIGLSLNDEKFVLRYAKGKISLGKPSYLASSCISVMNWFLDQNTL